MRCPGSRSDGDFVDAEYLSQGISVLSLRQAPEHLLPVQIPGSVDAEAARHMSSSEAEELPAMLQPERGDDVRSGILSHGHIQLHAHFVRNDRQLAAVGAAGTSAAPRNQLRGPGRLASPDPQTEARTASRGP